MPEPASSDGLGAPDPGDEGEEAPADPRLWFLRDPGAMARRLVLAEILGEPRGRRSTMGAPSSSPGARRR